MADYFYLFVYNSFAFLAKVLPIGVMDSLLRGLASFAYRVDKKHYHIINANLKLAFGDELTQKDRDSIGKRVFYNLLQTIIGFMRRNGRSSEELLQNVTFKNEHILQEFIDKNKKILFVTGHYSNWELLPSVITAKFGIKLVGVGRKLDSNLMDKILKKNREQFGVEMLYRKGAIKGMIASLKKGKAVGLLLDQHLGAKQGGVKIKFFGHKAMHSPAGAILARSMNIEAIPAYISTDDYKNYTVTFYPPLPIIKTKDKESDILSMTQAQAKVMEDVIRAKPNEWFWVHKRWKGFYPEIYQRDKS